jgi:integrase/recombinase XerD
MLRPGEKRLFIAEGKRGHTRIVPVSPRFFTTLAAHLDLERPPRCQWIECSSCSRARGGVSALRGRVGRDRCGRTTPCRDRSPDVSSVVAHLFHPADLVMALEAIHAPGRASLDRIHRIYLHLAND